MFDVNLGALSGLEYVEYVNFFIYWIVFYGATVLARVGTEYYNLYLEVLCFALMLIFPAHKYGVLIIAP